MNTLEPNKEAPLRTGHQHPVPPWAPPAIGIGIVCVALVIGGMYLDYASKDKGDVAPDGTERINNEPETPRATADVQILETMSPSD